MTPNDFYSVVMPQVVDLWNRGCLCRRPGFLKLMSFDFRTCGSGPAALLDLEAILQQIILPRFAKTADWTSLPQSGGQVATYLCPDCGTVWHAEWEDFNISFARTRMTFDGSAKPAAMGLYLVGFYGLGRLPDPPDFRRAATVAEFLAALSA